MPPPSFPWIGRIKPWSAAFRSSPNRPQASSQGVMADLPRGTRVTVVNRNGGWLLVQATLTGGMREGYVSQELVEYVSVAPPAPAKTVTQALPVTKRRLFFAVYYRVADHAFKRAAETWSRRTRTRMERSCEPKSRASHPSIGIPRRAI